MLGRRSPSGGRRTRSLDSSCQTPFARTSCGGRTGGTSDPRAEGPGAACSRPRLPTDGHARELPPRRRKGPDAETGEAAGPGRAGDPTEPFQTAAADAPRDTGAGDRWDPTVLRTTPGQATAPGAAYEVSVPVAERARGNRAPAKVSGLSTARENRARVKREAGVFTGSPP